MSDLLTRTARDPFWFYDCFLMRMPLGLKASNLQELLQILQHAPDAVFYYHMFQSRLVLTDPLVEYPNDFAQWAGEALQDANLAEQLSSFDPFDCQDLTEVRTAVIDIIEGYLWEQPSVPYARPGFELYLSKASTAIVKSRTPVNNLQELYLGMKQSGLDTFYYHFYEARWRLGVKKVDDFSFWIEYNFALPELVQAIRDLDIYFYGLPELRRALLALFNQHLEVSHERLG